MIKTKLSALLTLLFVLVMQHSIAQEKTITGIVSDESGPLPGVSVVIKGTTTGTETDFDGNYSITANVGDVLQFNFLGMRTQEVTVGVDDVLNISMEADNVLEEVVVTGLASSVKRENLANAVSTVSSEQLVGTTAQATMDGALYGKVPGVNITSTSGAPGGGFALRLRGVSSINGNNQPLIIVDGVYYNNVEIPSGLRFASGANRGNEENNGNRLADLDPNDIQNIEILKGSSAAAIYGQRGNAGVVIITTKRGKTGKTKINFSQDVGMSKIANPLGLRPWTAQSVEDAFGADERQKYEETITTRGSLFDYEDIIYGETGFITDTRLSATGGNEKTTFYVGGGYRDETGIIKNTGFDRLSLRANIEHKISDVFDFTSTTNYTRSNSSRSFTGNENDGGLSFGYTLAFTRPWYDLFPDENGTYPNNPNYSGNPLFVRDNAINEDTNDRIVQGINLNTKILTTDTNKIKLVLSGGLDVLANQTYVYVPEIHQAQIGGGKGFIGVGKNSFQQFNSQAIMVWDHDAMKGDLGLTTQVGVTYLTQESNLVNSRGSRLASGQTNVDQSVNQVIDQFLSEEEDFGYFGQIEANYKSQIIATLGYRLDKSSRNGDPNKSYGFPKASLAVNVANFDFWSSDTFNQFKVRAAYGETGNPASFGATFTSFGASNIGGNIGQSVDTKGDPDIKPETAQELEMGIDLGILNNRVSLQATYYDKKVKDLILKRTLPGSSGFTDETTNLADMTNKGFELSVNADIIQKEDLLWNLSVQYYKNVSEITRLDVPAFPQPGAGFGLSLGTFFIEEGSPVTQIVGNIDTDNDPDTAPEQIRVGDVEPDFQMGFSNTFKYKQLDISFLFHWKKGGENINLTPLLSDLGKTTFDLETTAGQERLSSPSNALRFVQPADYLKLREAAIHYNLPSKTVKSIFGDTVERVKFGISGKNLWTVTDYNSYDPEVSVNGGSGLSSGIEVGPFPSSRQFFFHLNVNF